MIAISEILTWVCIQGAKVFRRMLNLSLLKARLASKQDAWPIRAASKVLRIYRGVMVAPGEASFSERFQEMSDGIKFLGASHIETDVDGRNIFTTNDPSIIFSCLNSVSDQIAVELTFIVHGGRIRAKGRLYLDYGHGFSEANSIPLLPRQRQSYKACLIRPAEIKRLRWDPDEAPGSAWITGVHARKLGPDELSAHLSLLSQDELVGVGMLSREALDTSISCLITSRAFGHEGTPDYELWIANNEPSPEVAPVLWASELASLTQRPQIAVLVPVYNTPELLLRDMIDSVVNQIYPDWELCIADDASTAPHVRTVLEEYRRRDSRIKVTYRDLNGHISEASNSALELVTAPWVALLDHDDLLTPDALLAVAKEVANNPQAEFIYSDEDKLSDKGQRYDAFFKPDFSPELLRSQNYLNHLSVHRAQAIRAVGGWRKGFEGSQDYDLNLRVLEKVNPALVRHIPSVLYHWRAVSGSTALAAGEKNYAVEAGLKALSQHLRRMSWDADASIVPGLPFYRVRYHVPEPPPLVSIIIPTRDRADLLSTCIDSVLEKTDYPAYEILIADNGSAEPSTFQLFDHLTQNSRIRIVDSAGPFNYSKINNDAVLKSAGDIICLLNNDIEVITPEWLTEMVGWAIQPRIGCVGAKLYYPNDTIQHAGVILGIGGVAGHAHKYLDRTNLGYYARAMLSHDVSAVTGACLVLRRHVWEEVRGLEEKLAVAFNDVDLCLRVAKAGYKNVFTPHAELYHHESPSRGDDLAPEKLSRFKSEVNYMMSSWAAELGNDPFYSPNLSKDHEDFRISDV